MSSRCWWYKKLLGYSPPSHDQIRNISIGKSPQRNKKRKWFILSKWFISTIVNWMKVHIIHSNTHAIFKNYSCQISTFHILTCNIFISHNEIFIANWSPTFSHIRNPRCSFACFQFTFIKFERFLWNIFKPLVIS